jgi:GTP-binding protein
MELDEERRAVLADIPGLIEGASKGAGLGDRFLRHIERTGLLIHLVAPPEPPGGDGADLVETYEMVRRELEAYSEALAAKPELVVLTKIDLLEETARADYLNALEAHGLTPLAVSAVTGEEIDELIMTINSRLEGLSLI